MLINALLLVQGLGSPWTLLCFNFSIIKRIIYLLIWLKITINIFWYLFLRIYITNSLYFTHCYLFRRTKKTVFLFFIKFYIFQVEFSNVKYVITNLKFCFSFYKNPFCIKLRSQAYGFQQSKVRFSTFLLVYLLSVTLNEILITHSNNDFTSKKRELTQNESNKNHKKTKKKEQIDKSKSQNISQSKDNMVIENDEVFYYFSLSFFSTMSNLYFRS